MMKKMIVAAFTIGMLGITFPVTISHADHHTTVHGEMHENKAEFHEQFRDLVKQGYTKKDIVRAFHIAKKSGEDVEEILKHHKETQSWEKTAEHYGVDLEKMKEEYRAKREAFIEDHKDAIMSQLSEYTGKTEKELNELIESGVPISFLVKASIVSKVAETDFDKLVAAKRKGKSFKEMTEDLNIDQEALHKEMKEFMKEVKGEE
ncbi:hypothetical protein [Thalassobacillus hwangdonensis]|uniref:Uncharacterized protein n=1 Tax=Thalassobacillus hwangdonensis TaxID=546108 RepID=A0ABW3L041_9BACI